MSPYHLAGGAVIVFQMGTAKNGARDLYSKLSEEKLRALGDNPQVRMIEIKLSQGAKPGKGGILPGAKVTEEIAKIRGIEVGRDAISPNRYLDVNSVSDLLDLIHRVREMTGKPTGFKSVIGAYEWLDELCLEVKRRGIASAPDFITVDSADGGTGAAPMPLMDDVGLPIRESLPRIVNLLIGHVLCEQTRLIASGKLVTPADVAWAYCVGAEAVVSARGFMFGLGCI